MDTQDALERYLSQLRANGRSNHTIAQAKRHVGLLATWLRASPIESLDHEKIAVFLGTPLARCRRDGVEKKGTSMNAMRSSLRAFFSYLHEAGMIRSNPARLIRRAICSGPPPRGLTDQEEKRLVEVLSGAPDRDRVLFTLMLRTGIRIGSALALNVQDVDLEERELHLRAKGDREEVAFMPQAVADDLRAWIGERTEGALFPGPSGSPIGSRHVRRRFQVLLEQAGIKRVRGTHSLRHTHAIRVYRRTGDIELVRAALLHKSLDSTLVYARCSRDRLRAVIA